MPLSEEVLARIEEKKKAALALKRKREEEKKVTGVSEGVVDTPPLGSEGSSTVRYCLGVSGERVSEGVGEGVSSERRCGNVADKDMFESYGESVCTTCAQSSEQYEQLTQQDVTSQYLLTHSTIRMMKFQEKDNPRNPNWSMMKLYLRKHAMALALERWGSEIKLQEEIDKRNNDKVQKQLESVSNVFSRSGECSGSGSGSGESNGVSEKTTKAKRRKISMAAIVANMKGGST